MSHAHTSSHSHRTNAQRQDPTQTTGTRREFAAACYRRFRSLKGLIRETVEENDALRVGQRQNARPRDDFRFEQNDRKQEAFMRWLRQAMDDEVLEPVGPAAARGGRHWTATYIRSASRRGIKNAHQALREQGFDVDAEELDRVFNAPVHRETVRSIYLRAYDALEGITSAVDQEISRELAQGFVEGVGPRELASRLNERVDSIGITRARTMARTEVIRAANESTLDRLESVGIDEVTGQVEHLTAQDSRVCPTCRALGGSTYSIDEARGRIPVHPSCRCTWVPVV